MKLKTLLVIFMELVFSYHSLQELTNTEASRAAIASMSAQETTPGHIFSTSDLAVSITLKPLTEFLFCNAVLSPVNEGVSSSKTDASQPYQPKNLKS